MSAPKETPLMKQYNAIKEKYPDAILLFRVGDFYETFDNDAVIASKTLGITLTKRNNGAAMSSNLAGFPHHSLDTYLPKLVKAGYRVAICDQLEDPKMTKTIVKRGVTELVTPGVTVNDKILNHQTNNFLCSIASGDSEYGISFLDISTGEFLVSQGSKAHIDKLIQSFQPAEIIFSKKNQQELSPWFDNRYYTFMVDDWVYQYDTARDLMLRHFETTSLKGFGIEELTLAITAAGATLHYLKTTEHNQLQHINAVQRIAEDKYVWLDRFTIRNLELLDSPFHDGVPLIKVIDKTQSPMGARMLRRWLLLPLKDAKPIEERLSVVDYFLRSPLSVGEGQGVRFSISTQLQSLGDLERLISKVPMARVTPREVVQLKKSLQCIETIKNICSESNQTTLQKWADQLNPCLHIRNRIEKEIHPEPPALANRGGIIASGVHTELDELREISSSSKDYLLKIQQKAAEETGITTLKISFNNVFGYYLEVTNSHKNKVPASWIRKQTLTNAERYITEELKVFEEKILGAEEKINAIEQKLFEQIVKDLAEYVQPIQVNANVLAQIDCLISFATIASENNYTKPHLTDDGTLQIKDGRHPVIEKQLPVGESYVPNDIFLDRDTQQIIIITGPNMAGKSALLRQTALIVLMAQAGSFVPASHATISLVDKIFTRVGASDNISSGESTFMVEMNETASILNNISNDSLVLLDEIGRGTSTYDGISIAWSIAEYLHNHPLHKPKTLFATHYHELTELAEVYTKIKNFNVSVHEHEGKIIFLRKLKQGGSQHSFGIQVAKMAGMPANLIQRANEMMHKLEEKSLREQNRQQLRSAPAQQMQLNIFDPMSDEMKDIIQQLKMLDINKTSPVEALMKLIELKGMVR